MSDKIYNKFLYYFLLLLVIYLPLLPVTVQLIRLFSDNEAITFWLSHFYEPLVFFALIIALFRFQIRKTTPFFWILIGYLIFNLLSIIFISPNFSVALAGFRFSSFFLLLYLIAYSNNFDQQKRQNLVNTYLFISFGLSAFALIERLLPLHFWHNWFNFNQDFGFGYFSAGFAQRSASIIGAPNQLASYLLPSFFIVLDRVLNNKKTNLTNLLFLAVVVVAIIFTFSRSAIIGLLVSIFIFIMLFFKKRWQKITITAIAFLLIATACFVYLKGSTKTQEFISHGTSQSEHLASFHQTVDYYRTLPYINKIFGSGVGTAGPIALKYQGLISESWYLQLLLEFGMLGVAFWLSILYFLFLGLYKGDKGLFFSLLSISITALFLHTWADNPSISITLFILMAIKISDLEAKANRQKLKSGTII